MEHDRSTVRSVGIGVGIADRCEGIGARKGKSV